jgi:hypothetical protein
MFCFVPFFISELTNSSCLSVTKVEFELNVAATSEAHKLSIKYYRWGVKLLPI